MNMTGMIFQFNSDDGRGLIMLSDGETKEFSINQWIDTNKSPTVGLKIFYDMKTNKVSSEMHKEETEEANALSFGNVEEYIEHFKEDGFNLVKDFEDEEVRTITFRKYAIDEPLEIIIRVKKGEITVTYMVNGKKVE